MSQLSVCLDNSYIFLLSEKEALSIVAAQVNTIIEHWEDVCDEAQLSEIDRKLMVGRQVLNPFAFDNLIGERAFLKEWASTFKLRGKF